jgi:hypothetical protein
MSSATLIGFRDFYIASLADLPFTHVTATASFDWQSFAFEILPISGYHLKSAPQIDVDTTKFSR